MSDRTDPAWDEYLSTGIDPTGGELEAADEEEITDEIIPGQWQRYARRKSDPEADELIKLRNHERIRANRERIKWEREHPKEAKFRETIQEIVAAGFLITMFILVIKACS